MIVFLLFLVFLGWLWAQHRPRNREKWVRRVEAFTPVLLYAREDVRATRRNLQAWRWARRNL